MLIHFKREKQKDSGLHKDFSGFNCLLPNEQRDALAVISLETGLLS